MEGALCTHAGVNNATFLGIDGGQQELKHLEQSSTASNTHTTTSCGMQTVITTFSQMIKHTKFAILPQEEGYYGCGI